MCIRDSNRNVGIAVALEHSRHKMEQYKKAAEVIKNRGIYAVGDKVSSSYLYNRKESVELELYAYAIG